MVIWVTGISGAGKTTLCHALAPLLRPHVSGVVLLDGDVIREVFGGDLGYRESDRMIQVRRIQAFARLVSAQGVTVIAAVLYAHPELLAWNRRHLPDYFEVYLKAPLELVQRRDVKGIYRKATQGLMADVVGLDIPWHEPVAPDLVIDATQELPPELLARQVVMAIPAFADLLSAQAVRHD